MWGDRRERREIRELEARLRSARSTPRDGFVRELSRGIPARRAPRPWSRIAFAGAVTTLLLGTFASLGGVSYTASSATLAYQTAKKLTHAQPVKVHSAAADQYKPKPQQTAGVRQTRQAGVAQVEAAQSLPFTGFPLAMTALVSLVLIAVGLALRRRERRDS
jgi:hypothetical protein